MSVRPIDARELVAPFTQPASSSSQPFVHSAQLVRRRPASDGPLERHREQRSREMHTNSETQGVHVMGPVYSRIDDVWPTQRTERLEGETEWRPLGAEGVGEHLGQGASRPLRARRRIGYSVERHPRAVETPTRPSTTHEYVHPAAHEHDYQTQSRQSSQQGNRDETSVMHWLSPVLQSAKRFIPICLLLVAKGTFKDY